MYRPKANTEVTKSNLGQILLKALKWTGCKDYEDVAREVLAMIYDISTLPELHPVYRKRLQKATETLAEELKERGVYFHL